MVCNHKIKFTLIGLWGFEGGWIVCLHNLCAGLTCPLTVWGDSNGRVFPYWCLILIVFLFKIMFEFTTYLPEGALKTGWQLGARGSVSSGQTGCCC